MGVSAAEAYENLICDLYGTRKPWDDAGYVYMNLTSAEAALWLRTVPDMDVLDVLDIETDALQAYVVRLLESAGQSRKAVADELCDWLMHRALMKASKSIARDVYSFVPEDDTADCIFLKRQAG